MRSTSSTQLYSTISQDQHGTEHTRLRSYRLVLARVVWVVLVVLIVAFYFANLPVYFVQLQTVCMHGVCAQWQLTAANARTLHNVGFSIGQYAVFSLVLSLFLTLVWFAVGAFIVWRKSDDWLALLTSLLLVVQGFLELLGFLSNGDISIPLAYNSSAWYMPTVYLLLLFSSLIILVFSLFPDGRFVPGWMRWLVPGEVVLNVIFLYASSSHPKTVLIPLLATVLWFFTMVSLIGGQQYRYRRVSSPTERQQIKWIIFGLIVELGVSLVYFFPALLFPELRTPGSLYFLLVKPLALLLGLFGPLCFAIAILRYRLWDIDLIINRTLVYGTLSASVIGMYVLVVVYLGTLLRTGNTPAISLVATGVVAVLFQPLRTLLQRGVNRLMYGERDDPYAVLARLGSRLEATLVPEKILPTIVETVAQTLKLPYVAIALLPEQHPLTPSAAGAGAEVPDIVASSGTPTPDPVRMPLVYQAETIGYLLLAARAGDTFGRADQRLITDLARQAGVAVYAVRLTTHLQHLTESLQESRERLVTTREEERRRLRRDLHDGLGPTLASLTFKVDAARNLLTRDSERAEVLLVAVRQQAQEAITDIRRLVYNLRPPALDELGLLSALREQVAHSQHQGLEVVFDTPPSLPALLAAVEVAVYRIAQEALTNVTRHAHAQHCLLRLFIDAGTLHLDISDDGQGIPAEHRIGIGLHTMHERASELGGSCAIIPGSSGGTTIHVRLPLGGTRDTLPLSAQEREHQQQNSTSAPDVSLAHQEE